MLGPTKNEFDYRFGRNESGKVWMFLCHEKWRSNGSSLTESDLWNFMATILQNIEIN